MKTIAFFSEKGGVGKSTFTIMYASWLKYRHGINCAVFDFDLRMNEYREREIRARGSMGLPVTPADKRWPIFECEPKRIEEITKSGISNVPYVVWFRETIKKSAAADTQVAILDFPGALGCRPFNNFLCGNLLGLTCIPVDRDEQTLIATMSLIEHIKKYPSNPNAVGIITNVSHLVSPSRYSRVAKIISNQGLPVLPDIISFSERVKELHRDTIMRSTLRYPDWNDKAFEGSGDLGFDNLFTDVTRELDKTNDITLTAKADLSFVHGLKKTPNPKRQLSGTAFPEYEVTSAYEDNNGQI